MQNTLDESNYTLFAAHYYDNANCTDLLEFQEDLNRIKYIKRLLKKYHETGILKERLILNHLIVVYNVFAPEAATKMLCYKLIDYLPYLKPFLEFLSYWPDYVDGLGRDGMIIKSSEIHNDRRIEEILRNI